MTLTQALMFLKWYMKLYPKYKPHYRPFGFRYIIYFWVSIQYTTRDNTKVLIQCKHGNKREVMWQNISMCKNMMIKQDEYIKKLNNETEYGRINNDKQLYEC